MSCFVADRQLSHYCSATGSLEESVTKARPRVVLISCHWPGLSHSESLFVSHVLLLISSLLNRIEMRLPTLSLCVFAMLICLIVCDTNKPEWTKKNIRDYTDADLERLYEQWEEDEEPLPEDERPEHLRKSPSLDMSKLDFSNPDNVLKLSKKGKTLMTFVSVLGNPTRQETESITALWQSSLQNSHIIADRFIVADDRAIFMFKDGSQAWEAKDFLIEQKQCKEVTIDNKAYPGKHSSGHTEL